MEAIGVVDAVVEETEAGTAVAVIAAAFEAELAAAGATEEASGVAAIEEAFAAEATVVEVASVGAAVVVVDSGNRAGACSLPSASCPLCLMMTGLL